MSKTGAKRTRHVSARSRSRYRYVRMYGKVKGLRENRKHLNLKMFASGGINETLTMATNIILGRYKI
jgi:hypothetical protein